MMSALAAAEAYMRLFFFLARLPWSRICFGLQIFEAVQLVDAKGITLELGNNTRHSTGHDDIIWDFQAL